MRRLIMQVETKIFVENVDFFQHLSPRAVQNYRMAAKYPSMQQ